MGAPLWPCAEPGDQRPGGEAAGLPAPGHQLRRPHRVVEVEPKGSAGADRSRQRVQLIGVGGRVAHPLRRGGPGVLLQDPRVQVRHGEGGHGGRTRTPGDRPGHLAFRGGEVPGRGGGDPCGVAQFDRCAGVDPAPTGPRGRVGCDQFRLWRGSTGPAGGRRAARNTPGPSAPRPPARPTIGDRRRAGRGWRA